MPIGHPFFQQNAALRSLLKEEGFSMEENPEPRKCPYCGGSLPAEADHFCPHCGKALETKKPANPPLTDAKTPSIEKGDANPWGEKWILLMVSSSLSLALVYGMFIALFNLVYERDVIAFFSGQNTLLYFLLFSEMAFLILLLVKGRKNTLMLFLGLSIQGLILLLDGIYLIQVFSTFQSGLAQGFFSSWLAAPLIYWLYLFSSLFLLAFSFVGLFAILPQVKYAKTHGKL